MKTLDEIKRLLESTFKPSHLEVIDESYKHAGHAGAKEHGGGHYKVVIASAVFAGKSRVESHRLINAALKPLWDAGAIHALQIEIK